MIPHRTSVVHQRPMRRAAVGFPRPSASRLWTIVATRNHAHRHVQSHSVVLQAAAFSSKRRTRFQDDSKRDDKIFAGLRIKQQEQLQRLRDALATEDKAKRVAEGADESSKSVAANDAAKTQRDFERMMARKSARQARVKHLPLFRPGSALWHRYGSEQTLLDYEHLPSVAFDGPVEVIHSSEEELPFVEYLDRQRVIGVDTESMPRFDHRKKMNPVCLIQIATLERSFLYRIPRGGRLPPKLRALLEDPQVVKVGHSLDDDFRLLEQSKLVSGVHTTVDTLPIATKLGCLRPGLKTLCQLFLGATISKDMQVSDWEATELSADQIRYAATDAWAPLSVMLKMIQVQDAKQLLVVKNYNSGGDRTTMTNPSRARVALEECVLEHSSGLIGVRDTSTYP